MPQAFAQAPEHLHRLCGDGADQLGGRAADRRGLERRWVLVVAVGAERRGTRRATRSAATRCSRPPRTATFIPSGRWSQPSASRTSSSSTRPMRCWSRTRQEPRTWPASSPAESGRPQGARKPASAATGRGASSRRSTSAPRFQVKLLHVKPGGKTLDADAPPSLRALGGRARHGQGHDRRRGEARAREPVGLHRRHASGTGWRTPARRRWRSSRCSSAATWARTTSCVPTTSTIARPRRRNRAGVASVLRLARRRFLELSLLGKADQLPRRRYAAQRARRACARNGCSSAESCPDRARVTSASVPYG